jgi:hypothetical protein
VYLLFLGGAANPTVAGDSNSNGVLAHARVTVEIPPDIDISQDWWNEFSSNRTEAISDAWFSQHLVNLDWMEMPQIPTQ